MEEDVGYAPYSVLMSVYVKENPQWLRSSLDSMVNQTVVPNEIVMMEDGPLTNELYEVLDEYSAKYKFFHRYVNETNVGLGKSLNKGVELCQNELIARMDTDDISCLDRCEKQLKFFAKNPDVDVVGTQLSEFIESKDESVGKRIVPCSHEEICKFLKKRDPFNHPTVMFKKSAVLQAGNYLDMHFNEDFYLWIRMFENGAKFANLDEILLNMRVSADLYARRGGLSYYKSQKQVFKYLRKQKIISFGEYTKAKFIRFVVQVLMPNKIRQWAYKKFVRE